MFRSRGQNLRSVFVLLFLNVAFFLIEQQDPDKYARMFSFDRDAVLGGEVWRLVTYQFTQSGRGFFDALALFITLLLLYIMGSALEEEWGTRHFMTLFLVSTLGSAGVAAWLGIPLLGTYFVFFSLLFVYAATFPRQTFYLFMVVPVSVRLLAGFALAVLLYGVFAGGQSNAAALGGAVLAYGYFLTQRVRFVPAAPAASAAPEPENRLDTVAIHNAARFAAIKQALASKSNAEIDRLASRCDRDVVAGVNVCPPADYKPENVDGYCIRCEGFAECSARHLRLNRPRTAGAPLAAPNPEHSG
jgi:membrane associated rhomboid family serine protease